MRIFISYGNDEHLQMAQRLRRDLMKSRHQVWLAEDKIRPPEAWEACIERGLD